MLTALSIRDVVLIERLDIPFGPGLTVLTGETGAGKSILLDSLGLALGARAEAAQIRTGAVRASVAASFTAPVGHPVHAVLAEHGLEAEEDLVLRRVVARDGPSRAFINDQPVGVALLRRIGVLLVEVQGQHEQMGLADPSTHAALLDAFGVGLTLRSAAADGWRAWRDCLAELEAARAALELAERDKEFLSHAVKELVELAPLPGEEDALDAERQRLQHAERRGEAYAAALTELAPRDRRNSGPASALRAAGRALQRSTAPGQAETENPASSALAALERAEEAVAEAESLLNRLVAEADADPRLLEQAEGRLFALRAAARKYAVAVAELPALLDTLSSRFASIETGAAALAALEAAAARARAQYVTAATTLSEARQAAAGKLERAVTRELAPLRLGKARFYADVASLPELAWGPGGTDAVRFLIATNPGQEPGPLARVASGGELSRLMLALKVVLAGGSRVPTLVFDEVDSGIGGATAAAVGERLARVAREVQVLVVTHSPQVAARGTTHLRVAKAAQRGRAATLVDRLNAAERREEIARMLAGETITEAARAAADELLASPA